MIKQFLDKRFFMNEKTHLQTEWKPPHPLKTHPIISKGKLMDDGSYELFIRKGDTLTRFIDRLYGFGKRCELTPFIYIQLVNSIISDSWKSGKIKIFLDFTEETPIQFHKDIYYLTYSEHKNMVNGLPENIRGVWLYKISHNQYLGLAHNSPKVLTIDEWIEDLYLYTKWWLGNTTGNSSYDGRIRIHAEFLCNIYHLGQANWCLMQYYCKDRENNDKISTIIDKLKKGKYPGNRYEGNSWGIAMDITPSFTVIRVISNSLLFNAICNSFETFVFDGKCPTRAQLNIKYEDGWVLEYQVYTNDDLDERYSLAVRVNWTDDQMYNFVGAELGKFYDMYGTAI